MAISAMDELGQIPPSVERAALSTPDIISAASQGARTRPKHRKDTPAKRRTGSRTGRLIAKVGMAAVCIIPPADLALSDATFAKVYQSVSEHVELENKAAEHAIEFLIVSSVIMLESIGLGLIISRNRKLQNAFDDFEAYNEDRMTAMSAPRRAISYVVNAPFAALQKAGAAIEGIGNRIGSRSKNKIGRNFGRVLIDMGVVNAIGTSAVILQETAAGNPPSLKRNAYLATLITIPWMGLAQGIQWVYRNVPVTRPPLRAIGVTFNTLTSVDLSNPAATPVGTIVLGSAALGLAVTGWKIGAFHEQQQAADQTISMSIPPIGIGPDANPPHKERDNA